MPAGTGALGRPGISIESIVQRGRADAQGQAVPVLIVTHEAAYADVTAAVAELDALPAVQKGTFVARMIPGPGGA